MFFRFRFSFLITTILALMILSTCSCFSNRYEKRQNTYSGTVTGSTRVILGSDLILDDYAYLIAGKRIGLVTNQTGVDSNGTLSWQKLALSGICDLEALFVPEHGLFGNAKAGEFIPSYVLPDWNLTVYSLYGETRMPTEQMLQGLDVLVFDIQDIGSRAYTYISTLNYVMKAAEKFSKPVIVLDRPNPLGDQVDGFVLESDYVSFVGVDLLPLSHGMTIGEMARFFNRNFRLDLTIVPMKNYSRGMVYPETGLDWIASSPHIPDINSVFCYMVTGLAEGTDLYMDDDFKWFGIRGFDQYELLLEKLNSYRLPGVGFELRNLNGRKGIGIIPLDYKTFSPVRTGIYIVCAVNEIGGLKLPAKNSTLFDKLYGTDRMRQLLIQHVSAEQIINSWNSDVREFIQLRKKYLIYQ